MIHGPTAIHGVHTISALTLISISKGDIINLLLYDENYYHTLVSKQNLDGICLKNAGTRELYLIVNKVEIVHFQTDTRGYPVSGFEVAMDKFNS